MGALRARASALAGPAGRTIVSNAGAIALTMTSSAVLGYPYWWLAARQFPPATVGFGAAVTSAMTLLGTLGVLGLATLVVDELPRQRGRELTLIGTAVAAAALVAGGLGAAFALGGAFISTDWQPLANPAYLALFTCGTGLTAAGLVLDQAFIGLLRGGLQLARYLLFGAVKLGALVALAMLLPARDGLAIVVSWVLGSLFSILPLGRLIAGQSGHARSLVPDWRLLRGRGRAALSHHFLNTGLQVPYLTLPILVTSLLSATDNAYFFAAWTLSNMVFLICGALTAVLYAMGVRQPEALASHTRLTLAVGLGCGVVAGGLLAMFGEVLLGVLFGATYAEHASPVLRVLILGAFPVAIVDHYVALSRIHRRTFSAAWLVLVGGLLQLGLATLGARTGGLIELTWGWVLGLGVEAAFMLPLVWRTVAAAEPLPALAEAEGRA
jgi:O-antigen/teichoic acid export membrane protein